MKYCILNLQCIQWFNLKNSVNILLIILEINGLYFYFYFKFKMLFLIQVCVEMSIFLAALSNHESRQMFTIVIVSINIKVWVKSTALWDAVSHMGSAWQIVN